MLIFEISENTQFGMNLINKYITFCPGGKPKADSITNIIGDNIAAYLGWYSAYLIDNMSQKYNWYQPHRIN